MEGNGPNVGKYDYFRWEKGQYGHGGLKGPFLCVEHNDVMNQ